MKVAIIGTRGIPANYGGFETLAERLTEELGTDFEITVCCSSKYYKHRPSTYKGAKLVYLNIGANRVSGILYDTLSLLKTLPSHDKVIMLGAPAGFILPLLGRWKKKIIFNYGGLDFNRSKWNSVIQKFIKWGKDLATKHAGCVVADNKGIQDYIKTENKRNATLIAYGADHVTKLSIEERDKRKYPFLGTKYALVVARIQKDNNIETVIKAFVNRNDMPLVVIGNWDDSKWGRTTRETYRHHKNLALLDAINHQPTLDKIRSSCSLYIHGHSAGGTNPSLVEAMYIGLPIIAFKSVFNRYTTKDKCLYFTNNTDLNNIIDNTTSSQLQLVSEDMRRIAIVEYTWKRIAAEYKKLILV